MAGDLIPLVQMAKDVDDALGNYPSVFIAKGGEIVLTELYRNRVKEFFRRYSKAKEEGQIPPDFETTEHGQTLLQEALDALWQARDQKRAEAIQQVFLGLAMSKPEDSLEQVEQLQLIRIAAEMTTWEVMLCNALEQYSALMFDQNVAKRFEHADSDVKDRVRSEANKRQPEFSRWLKVDYSRENEAIHVYLIDAWDSLQQKRILRAPSSGRGDTTGWSATEKRGAFTKHGWKLAQYLYEAKVPTEVEVKTEAK